MYKAMIRKEDRNVLFLTQFFMSFILKQPTRYNIFYTLILFGFISCNLLMLAIIVSTDIRVSLPPYLIKRRIVE
jgi:hypothetical protein